MLDAMSSGLHLREIIMAFDTRLMEILACPVCKGKLDYNKEQQELICKFDRLAYAIEKDIPVLLESEARRISADND